MPTNTPRNPPSKKIPTISLIVPTVVSPSTCGRRTANITGQCRCPFSLSCFFYFPPVDCNSAVSPSLSLSLFSSLSIYLSLPPALGPWPLAPFLGYRHDRRSFSLLSFSQTLIKHKHPKRNTCKRNLSRAGTQYHVPCSPSPVATEEMATPCTQRMKPVTLTIEALIQNHFPSSSDPPPSRVWGAPSRPLPPTPHRRLRGGGGRFPTGHPPKARETHTLHVPGKGVPPVGGARGAGAGGAGGVPQAGAHQRRLQPRREGAIRDRKGQAGEGGALSACVRTERCIPTARQRLDESLICVRFPPVAGAIVSFWRFCAGPAFQRRPQHARS